MKHLSPDAIDRITEWILCQCPCAPENTDFIRGVLWIAEEAAAQAVLKEREKARDAMRSVSRN